MILPFRLNVHQFAACIQRREFFVRDQIRARIIKAEGKPYLIHPRELERYHVDQEMALDRLTRLGLLPVEARPVLQPS